MTRYKEHVENNHLIVKYTGELKPCPYCGGKPTMVHHRTYSGYKEKGLPYAVFCFECEAHTKYADTPDDAADNWNRRKFSRIQRLMQAPLTADRIQEEKPVNLIVEHVLKNLNKEYTGLLKSYDHARTQEEREEMLGKIRECERGISYWAPYGADPKSVMKSLRMRAIGRTKL